MQQYPTTKVAAVQIAPVMLDRDATIRKVCEYIGEAAENGAKIIGFPEAIVPGYPWWIWLDNPISSMDLYTDLYKNAVEIPSPSVQRLSEAARDAEAYVCVSVTELDGASLYLTQLWFNPMGDLVAKHRKLKATSNEMTVWGDGDGSMMPVIESEYGNLGGLQCWEHYIPPNVSVMGAKNEQIHVSSWPIGMADPTHPFSDQQCITAAMYYALSNGCYVILASQLWTEEQADRICKNDAQRSVMQVGHGFSRIIAPSGYVLSQVPSDQEGICYAQADLNAIIPVKYLIDTAGHYSTPGVMQLYVDESRQKAVHFEEGGDVPPVLLSEEIQFEE